MKYPRIPHVPFSNVYDLDDVVAKRFLFGREWIATEKIDGAQVSVEFIDEVLNAWNRNTDILHGGSDRQFHPFPTWLRTHYEALWDLMGNRHILFGEWVFHVHTVFYDKLPDWFIAFNLFDKQRCRFLDFNTLQARLASSGIHHVPIVKQGRINNEKDLLSCISISAFGHEEMEGLVLHSLDGQERMKFVTRSFKELVDNSAQHWRWNPHRRQNILLKSDQ